jgi:uncharacterized protein (TIGR02265 family)
MHHKTPLIKGMFINSHIDRLRREKGEAAVYELKISIGRYEGYNNFDDYPVREEIKVIETVLDILSDGKVDPVHRSFEAGRLHFRDFAETVFGKMTLGLATKTPEGFRRLMQMVNYIGQYVFKHTNFTSKVVDEHSVTITMENNDYPIDHFKGLFFEWAHYWGLKNPKVSAYIIAPNKFEYTVMWEK